MHSKVGATKRGVSTLRTRLMLLVLAVLVPALMSAGVLIWHTYLQDREGLTTQMRETARALALVVDRQIGQDRILLHSVVTSDELARGDWKAFDAEVRAMTLDSSSWVVVTGETGQFVNTLAPRTAPLPRGDRRQHPIGWNLAAEDGTQLSNLFTGALTKSPVIAVRKAVVLRDGRVVTVAVVNRAEALAKVWTDQDLPRTWTGVVIDRRGAIVARSRNAKKLVGRSISPSMLQRLAAPHGVAETRTLDGVESLTAWSRAPESGYTFVVAVPRVEVYGAARRSLIWGLMIGVGFLALGVALAAVVARSLVESVERLAQAAMAWGEGAEVETPTAGIKELDALAAALDHAAGLVNVHQDELKQLNASLEARVQTRTRELAEATESLAQAQKMEAIGRLTGGMAHDFNNLLMAVLGNLDLLERRITDPKARKNVEQARTAARRGASLTAQLLAFSRRQALEPRAISANQAVSQARALLEPTLGGTHSLAVVLADKLWPARGDPTQVELMVMNLAINARDAMPNGGVVAIATANVTLRTPSRPEEPPAGDYVMISVADLGEGMSDDIAARAFEPFFTTKAVGKGSGLGLPQVLGLAKQLGGGVSMDTAPGEGTVVRVYLPRAEAAPQAAVSPAPVAPAGSLDGLRLLLIDDDPAVRLVTGELLGDLGCLVTQADGGAEGLLRLQDDPRLQVALIDFAMPGMNGGETAQALTALRPDLGVVIMTGYADLDQLTQAWSGPVLRKPFDDDGLVQALTAVLPPPQVAAA